MSNPELVMPNVVSFPPGTVVIDMPVAPFVTPTPHIRHADRIPASVRDTLENRWNTPHDQHRIVFHLLKNVYVSGEGLIFDEDNNLYRETIAQNDGPLLSKAYQNLVTQRDADAIPFVPGPTLLCGKIGMSNYGHWMIEMLPMAYLARQWIAKREWRVFLPTVYFWMADVIRDSLEMLGVGRDQCIENDGSPVKFEQLIFISGISIHGHYYLPVSVDCMSAIAEPIPMGSSPLVWVSRAGERRALKDEQKVCAGLEAKGWEIVQPGKMTLRQQIEVAKGARHMAGVSGAGLTNMGFMRPGGVITDFMPATMPDIFYWHLGVHRGLEYQEVRVPVLSDPDWFIEWDGHLQIDQAELFEHLGMEDLKPA